MRLTKGMKKILSLALTGALVITGANVTGGANKQAKAEDAVDQIKFQTLYGVDKTIDLTGNGDYVIEDTGSAEGFANPGYLQKDVTKTAGVKVKVNSIVLNDTELTDLKGRVELDPSDGTENGLTNGWSYSEFSLAVGDAVYASADGTAKVVVTDKDGEWGSKLFEYQVNGTATTVTSVSYKVTVSGLAVDKPADPSASTEPSTEPSQAPAGDLPYGLVEGTEGAAVSTPFTAYIYNNGNVWGWDANPENPEATVEVTKEGTYRLSAVAAADADNLINNNFLAIGTDLLDEPDDFDMVGVSVTVDGDEYLFDSTYGRLYLDGEAGTMGAVRLGVAHNRDWNDKPWANAMDPMNTGVVIPVDEGDVITITFKVINQEPAHFDNQEEEPTPSVAPSTAPSASPSAAPATNACKKVTAAKKTVSVKRGKTKTITFKITNTNKSALTTDKISVKSSNKKVTAKVSKKTATKITVKVKVNKKAKKKSKAKITLKVGKKSAKTTIKVK